MSFIMHINFQYCINYQVSCRCKLLTYLKLALTKIILECKKPNHSAQVWGRFKQKHHLLMFYRRSRPKYTVHTPPPTFHSGELCKELIGWGLSFFIVPPPLPKKSAASY